MAKPLPECVVCEQPTSRAVHQRNGGKCSTCLDAYGPDAYVIGPGSIQLAFDVDLVDEQEGQEQQ